MSDRGNRILLVGLMAVACTNVQAADVLDDPTRPNHVAPATAVAPEGPRWVVESIIVSPTRRIATINGRVVGVDDWISGARVMEILPYEVRIDYKGESRRLSLVPTRVKRPATEW